VIGDRLLKKTPFINSFESGELDNPMDAQVKREQYYTGCKMLENMSPTPQGPAHRMPGTKFLNEVSGALGRYTDLAWTIGKYLVRTFGIYLVQAYSAGDVYSNAQAPVLYGDYVYFSTYKVTDGKGYFQKFNFKTNVYSTPVSTNVGAGAQLASGVVDSVNGYIYFANRRIGANSLVYKIDPSTFTIVDTLVLSEDYPCAMAVDPEGTYLYVAVDAGAAPSKIIKIDLSTFTEVSTISSGLTAILWAYHISYIDDTYAYFTTRTQTGRIIKVQLSDFTVAGTAVFSAGEENVRTLSRFGNYFYCGCYTVTDGKVVKVKIDEFTRDSALTITGSPLISSGVQRTGRVVFACTPTGSFRLFSVTAYDFSYLEANDVVLTFGNAWTGVVALHD